MKADSVISLLACEMCFSVLICNAINIGRNSPQSRITLRCLIIFKSVKGSCDQNIGEMFAVGAVRKQELGIRFMELWARHVLKAADGQGFGKNCGQGRS